MANLRGVIESDKSTVSRLSSHIIGAALNTHEGRIAVDLTADGRYFVRVNGKPIANGNVNEEQGE